MSISPEMRILLALFQQLSGKRILSKRQVDLREYVSACAYPASHFPFVGLAAESGKDLLDFVATKAVWGVDSVTRALKIH